MINVWVKMYTLMLLDFVEVSKTFGFMRTLVTPLGNHVCVLRGSGLLWSSGGVAAGVAGLGQGPPFLLLSSLVC